MSEDSEPEETEIQFEARNVDDSAGEIIGVLEDTSKGNVICFYGWNGLGASAALKVVAQRLKSSKSKFDKVVHLDCSVWKSRRELQKSVAKELELPQSVMDIFNWHDQEDDFNGVDEGARGVISDVTAKIFLELVNSRFVVIFHNGSGEYIDLYECGVPITRFLGNKVLWTWRGRFRLRLKLKDGERKKMGMLTDVVISASHGGLSHEEFWDLLREESKEVVTYMCIPELEPNMNHMIVMECFLYAWALGRANSGINWETHASNYWVCDGIIPGQGDTSAWEIGDALRRSIRLHWLLQEITAGQQIDAASLHCLRWRPNKRWVSATHQVLELQQALAPEVTSFLLLSDKTDSMAALPASIFQHSESSRLRVLHLSRCTFSFASPPFLCCDQLRLLHLDHCTNVTVVDENPSHIENILCFQKLWVLDLRYTEWYWLLSEKMKGLMADLRELNVEGVRHESISDLFHDRPRLVMLRVTANRDHGDDDQEKNNQIPFPNMSSANSLSLKTIILDGCVRLEQIVPGIMPPSLESFCFFNNAATTTKISSISFQGCSQLKSILLGGLFGGLKELNLSGTSVKSLDLREVETPNLKRLILLGCKMLCAILWPPENKRSYVLKVVHINTIRSASPSQPNWEESTNEVSASTRLSYIHTVATTQPGIGGAASFHFWYISVRDARLLRSLMPAREYIDSVYGYIEMDSSPTCSVAVGASLVAQRIGSLEKPYKYLDARDAIILAHLHDGAVNEGAISWIWACPTSPTPPGQDWYVHIQDEVEMKRGLLQEQGSSIEGTSTGGALLPSFICRKAWSLHVHDNSSIACIPSPRGSRWNCLRLCQVERCPKLRTVFATHRKSFSETIFWFLATFWASQLPMACYIWNWSAISQPGRGSFEHLVFLHLDYCPRLIHVLPLSKYMATLPHLETVEIVCCGDLREVFPLEPECHGNQTIIEFSSLRRIHLYELPTLKHICGSRMSAPKLETVKIRGCWSLKFLPAVRSSTTNRPKVDCEKDWWDNLEWGGLAANHHPSLYELTHSMYYKKAQLPRGPLLR